MTKIVIAEQTHKWVERCEELQKENTKLKSKLQLKETAYDFDTARLEEENIKLKELLKLSRGLMNMTKDWACTEATENIITKINQVLGEE